jgi:hypothetical protein
MDIRTAKAELEGILHGTTINKIQNVDGVFNRAGRQLLMDIDPQETKIITQFTTPIFNSVYDYALPADLKGNKVIDIRPQTSRKLNDRYSQDYNQDFDIYKEYAYKPSFTINTDSASKTIRINAPFLPNPITINQADDTTSNGTWAGTTTSIVQDTVNYAMGSASVSFNLPATATAYIENSTMSAIDLSPDENQSYIFYWVYLPTASNFTSVNIRFGSDSSNYWNATATTTHSGASFQNGWNLISVDWKNATKVLTPDSSAIDYVRITFAYNSTAMSGVKINGIKSILGKLMEIEYYSKYLFRNVTTGVFQETILDNSDLINLDTETYNAYLYLVALYAVQQSLGEDAGYDTTFFQQKYTEGITRYRGMYKSELQKPKSLYYRKSSPTFTKYLGRRPYHF